MAPSGRLHHGTLPVPPPDFSYESLSIGVGYQPFDEVTSLSWSILWVIVPSLVFFVALPLALRRFDGVTVYEVRP